MALRISSENELMNCLLDSNIFLEGILLQSHAEEVRTFLSDADNFVFCMSDFSLHSIGNVLFRRRSYTAFQKFIEDVVDPLGVEVLQLAPRDLSSVITAAQQYSLDFDDAYQYAVAEKYDLTIVSYDRDFDHTSRRRTTPGLLLQELARQNDDNQDSDSEVTQ